VTFLVRRFARMVFVLVVTTSFGALVAVTEWGDPFLRHALSGVSVFGWEAFPLIPRSTGIETTWLQNLFLPALTLGVGALACTAGLARGSMPDVLAADHIRTARAEGLSQRQIAGTVTAWLDPRIRTG
jgi:ABC-type microcin C transport system permease subunit YejB